MAQSNFSTPGPKVVTHSNRYLVPYSVRLAAVLFDASRLLLGSLAASLIACGFLFWRSAWGMLDIQPYESSIAAALLLASIPSWLAWILTATLKTGGTPGQLRNQTFVRANKNSRSRARLIRFASHPLSAPVWGWLAVVTFLLDARLPSYLFGVASIIVMVGGLGSIILMIFRLETLHDRIAQTTIEKRP